MWNITSSTNEKPQLVVTTTAPATPGAKTKVQTDITDLMSVKKMPDDSSSKIVAASAW